MLRKNCGIFRVSRDLINQNPKAVMTIMGQVVVIRAETLFHSDTVEYWALSEHFEEVGAGARPPEYLACTTRVGEDKDEYEAFFKKL